jgi:hypothetical protein
MQRGNYVGGSNAGAARKTAAVPGQVGCFESVTYFTAYWCSLRAPQR